MGAKKRALFFFRRKDGYAGLRKDIFCNFAKLRKKIFERNFPKKIDMPMPYEFLSATVHSNRIFKSISRHLCRLRRF